MSEDEVNRFEAKWKEIYTSGIQKVFRIAESKQIKGIEGINLTEYTKLYTIAYDICVSKSNLIPMKLYERILETIKNYCIQTYNKIKYSRQILLDFVEAWTIFEEIVLKWILKFFSYLTRSTFKVKKNLNLENDLKMIFKVQIYDPLSIDVMSSFFHSMNLERLGEIFDSSILKKFVKFLSSIEICYMEYLFNEDFENQILENSLKFYKPLISENFSKSNYILYINWGTEIIKKEEIRLNIYLPQKTIKNILNNLRENIFYSQSKNLLDLNESFKFLLKTQNLEELKKSFEVFSENPNSVHIMLIIFKNFIKEEFTSLIERNDSLLNITDGPREIISKTNFVEDFITFYKINNKIISEAFLSSNQFNISYKEVLENVQCAFTRFNNSYILPFYIDKYLKRSLNNHSQDTIRVIDNLLAVFPSLPDKDVFIDIHRNLLSSRILNEDFKSLDFEKNLISKLKLLCGVEFTHNLEHMINDYNWNKELNFKFLTWQKENNLINNQFQTNFSILTAEVWPQLNLTKIIIPFNLQNSIENFTNFYNKNFPKRLLQWSFQNSTTELLGRLENKEFYFVVNSIQAVILLTFNEFKESEVNIKEIMKRVGIENEKEFKIVILPLMTSKLLLKSDENLNGEFIKLNKKFAFSSKRVKILNLPRNDEIIRKEKIEDDRSYAIEATIARIMKSTQRLHHNELIRRVVEQMEHFKIQIQNIKKKIDNLLERDFIKRDQDDPNVYLYYNN